MSSSPLNAKAINKKWYVLHEQTIVDCSPWFQVKKQTIQLPDERVISDYHQIVSPPYAIIIAVDSETRIFMFQQYRHGPQKITWALPGGGVEHSESPLAAAQRELLEEAGFESTSWSTLGDFQTLSNYGGSRGFYFLARNAIEVRPPSAPDMEGGTSHWLTIEEVENLIDSNAIDIVDVAVALTLAIRRIKNGTDY